jgi:hypothetical protein
MTEAMIAIVDTRVGQPGACGISEDVNLLLLSDFIGAEGGLE